MYEYCIILKKYKHIKKYCQYKLESSAIYTIDKYFEYCIEGNLEAVYFCILEGVNAEKEDVQNGNRNVLIHSCENKRVELLRMLIDNF